MVDKFTEEQRSKMMSRVRSKNTSPELRIRSALFASGFRYRIHLKALPGCPDIVLPKYRAVICVHGCFWHGHSCKAGKLPATNVEFWTTKISKNKERDLSMVSELNHLGWKILIVWECSIKRSRETAFDNVIDRISTWIINGRGNKEL